MLRGSGARKKRALRRLAVATAIGASLLAILAWGPWAGRDVAASRVATLERAMPIPTVGPCRHKIGVRCGSIHVPMYWSRPEMGSLTVRFRIFEHTDNTKPGLEPVVGFEGGPGYGS